MVLNWIAWFWEVFLIFCPSHRNIFQYSALHPQTTKTDCSHVVTNKKTSSYNLCIYIDVRKRGIKRTLETESLSRESRLDRGAFSTTSAGFLTEMSCRLFLERTQIKILCLRTTLSHWLKRTEDDLNIIRENSSNNLKVSTCIAATYWCPCCPSGLP